MAGARKYHHGEVRETAVSAALALIEADGPDALTMRALAKAVGVDHRALYRHYPDRDAVLAEVAAEGYRQLLSDQSERCAGSDAPLQTAFEAYVHFALDRPHLHGLMLSRSRQAMDAHAALGAANITVNKNAVPNDPQSPFVTSGLRIGTPAVTTRGFAEAEVTELANWIADVLDDVENQTVIEAVRGKVLDICKRFPVYS